MTKDEARKKAVLVYAEMFRNDEDTDVSVGLITKALLEAQAEAYERMRCELVGKAIHESVALSDVTFESLDCVRLEDINEVANELKAKSLREGE